MRALVTRADCRIEAIAEVLKVRGDHGGACGASRLPLNPIDKAIDVVLWTHLDCLASHLLLWPSGRNGVCYAGGGSLRTFGSHRIRHATATLLVNNGMPLEEVSRYLGHSSTDVTRRYARQTPDALGRRAADALARAGLVT